MNSKSNYLTIFTTNYVTRILNLQHLKTNLCLCILTKWFFHSQFIDFRSTEESNNKWLAKESDRLKDSCLIEPPPPPTPSKLKKTTEVLRALVAVIHETMFYCDRICATYLDLIPLLIKMAVVENKKNWNTYYFGSKKSTSLISDTI